MKKSESETKSEKRLVKYKNVTEQITTSLTFYVFTLLMDLVMILCVTGKFPTFVWFGLTILHLLTLVIFVMPSQAARKSIAIVFLFIQLAICITNDILYHVTGEIFTFDKLLLASEAGGTVDISLINFWHVGYYALLFAGAVTTMFLLPKYIKKWRPVSKNFYLVFAAYAATLVGVLSGAAVGFERQMALWTQQYPSATAYNTYGYYGFYAPNIVRFFGNLFASKELTAEEKAEYLSYLNDGETPQSTEFSGISKDNNLIVILAESFDMAAIDPYFTPNLYKMWYQDGMFLQNYHSENKTNMSEGMVMFGSYSHARALNTKIEMSEVMSYMSLPTLLEKQATANNEEIHTGYYHSLAARFYNRNVTFDKVGYDDLLFTDMQEDQIRRWIKENRDNYKWQAWFHNFIKDSDFFEYNKEEMIPDTGRFFTYYTTLVTHGKYALRGSNQCYYDILTSSANEDKLENMLNDMELAGYYPRSVLEPFLIYKAAVMDFDKMIGEMFARLEETGNLENTTIVMYPDHNTYYDDISFNLRGIYGKDVRQCNVNAYNMGACIYDQKLIAQYKGEATYTSGVVVGKFVCVNDLYPTICDLFDLPYNTSLCYGTNIFLDEPRVMLSLKDNGYIFDNNFYYSNGEIFAVNPSANLNDEYFKRLVDEVLYKFKVQEDLYSEKEILLQYLRER